MPDSSIFYVLIPLLDYVDAVARGEYVPPDLATIKFIHASPPEQLTRVANKYYRDKKDVHLLYVDEALVCAPVRWEAATGGLYPHIYGPLNLDAIKYLRRVVPDANGEYTIDPCDL